MKRITLLSVIIFLLVGVANAQSFRHLSLKVGAASARQTWAYFSSTYKLESSTGWGINAGLAIELDLSPEVGLQFEALYVQKRMSLQIYNVGAEAVVEEQMRIHTVSVPILAIVNIPINAVNCYALVGPRLDILSTPKNVDGRDMIKDVNTFEIGGTFGVGIRSIVPRLGLELRYALNFMDYYSHSPELTITNGPSIQLLVTMML